MLEHMATHPLGLIHLLTGLTALALGTAVVLSRKGTVGHRWMGRGYLLAMLALNGTALSVYELYGRFGPFHWLSLVSLATLAGGYASVRRRRPGWIIRHACFMAGSFVGLVAALVAEVATRVPGWSFGPSALISSAVVVLAGVWLMARTIPGITGRR